jgi:hypothetical protein
MKFVCYIMILFLAGCVSTVQKPTALNDASINAIINL